MSRQHATPEDYALIFEQHRVGQKILDDLVARFGRRKGAGKDGISRVLDTFEYEGQRQVLDFICSRINEANGVDDNADIEASFDE
ncbi:MAG: hypothetical protein R3352_05820 [Salinisphaeraceae bacterium]|nr:hypothetical protein [Salinisphaeraceae bacterium]